MRPAAARIRTMVTRWLGLFVAWIVIAGADPPDLPAGIIAAALATWASLVLYPPGPHRIRLVPLLMLCLRLPLQSVLAGVDVACRALDPRLPLDPGFIRYRTKLPAGMPRSAFGTVMSLVPGTLPVGFDNAGTLLVHCLDVKQPVAASLARDEAVFHAALTGTRTDA
ncbi:MAG: Na+/H+ antiporter subunit E [Acetobacteraceae bacterium]